MNPLTDQLEISKAEEEKMVKTVQEWADINTHCSNLNELETMLAVLEKAFNPLGGIAERIKLPQRLDISPDGEKKYHAVGDALYIRKNPNSPFQILLAGHMDTVFEKSSPFQKTIQLDENHLSGPGVADMKGGIQVMLKSLELFERSQFANSIGWQVLITPDEEIGSPSSGTLYAQTAQNINVGLIYEPAFSDGKFASQRKGSLNLIAVAKGKTAHAGRDFQTGRNAIAALAIFITSAHALNQTYPAMNLNVGKINGGEAANIVPNLATCHINVRADDDKDLEIISQRLIELAKQAARAIAPEGIDIFIYPLSKRAPKPFDPTTETLFQLVQECGKALGMQLEWKASGGVCDGNILAKAGVATIDTLGVIGGNLHTLQEYMVIQSLSARARLSALLLTTLASNPRLHNIFTHSRKETL